MLKLLNQFFCISLSLFVAKREKPLCVHFILFIPPVSISRLKLKQILDSFDVLVDPWQQRSDARVDARILTLAAANAPGDDAHLGVTAALVHNHGTTRVTLCKRREMVKDGTQNIELNCSLHCTNPWQPVLHKSWTQ